MESVTELKAPASLTVRGAPRLFHVMVKPTWYGEGGGMCVHAETRGDQLALEHNGDLYSCDHFIEPDHVLGNIGDRTMLELIDPPATTRPAFATSRARAGPTRSARPAMGAQPVRAGLVRL